MDAGPGTIALTGGSGFLGSHIADALLAAGRRVRVAVRPTSSRAWLDGKDLTIVTVDLADAAGCRDFLAGTTALVHCAGVVAAPDEAAYRRGNVQPTEILLAAAAEAWADAADRTFLLVSSLAAHGPAPLDAPAREDQPARPVSAYGRSKRSAEEAVLGAAAPFRKVVLRPPSLYGPRDREFLPLLRGALRGWTVKLGRELTGLSLVDGRDAAAAVVALLDTPAAAGIYFVSDARTGYDWDDLRDALAAAAGRPVRRIEIPLGVLRCAAACGDAIARLAGDGTSLLLNRDRVRDLAASGWVCDGGRLTRDTGFVAARDAARGFAETIAAARGSGWL